MEMIRALVTSAVAALSLPEVAFSVDHPKDESHGDYSVNVAMILAKAEGKNPRELAQLLVEKIAQSEGIQKVEVAGPGFINFYLTTEFLVSEAKRALEVGYGKNDSLKGQKTMVEFTDPNPFKEFHIGHLMSNTIGESLTRLFEANGATVKRVNYQGDVGLHVAKSLWGMQKLMVEQTLTIKSLQDQSLQQRQKFMGQAYAYGATQYEEDEIAKSEMNGLNKVIYDKSDTVVDALYQAGRTWSLEYFETIYQRLGTKFDEYFFESEAGEVGLDVIEEALGKQVLEVGEEGAVVFKGETYGLHTRVFRNKLGLPTYEGKELGLAKTKYGRWEYDKSYIVTANEIDEYFKVLIKVLTLLYPELGTKTTHLSHGVMKLTSGKMSSRTGKVVTGEGLLNELKAVVLTKMGERDVQNKEVVADQVAVASLKYSVLKQAVGGDIVYEPEKMTNMDGDTGPYLQYTYARTQSVLRKAKSDSSALTAVSLDALAPEELSIIRWVYRYPETIAAAGTHYAPHMVAGYLYELSQRFNTFYNQHQILENQGRLLLTAVVGNILKSGLDLLGIVATESI